MKVKRLFGILFTISNTNYYILIGFICVFVVYSNSLSSIYYVSFDIDIFIYCYCYNSAINNKTKKIINNKLKNKIFNIQKHNKTEYKYVQSIEDIYIYIYIIFFLIYTYMCVLLLRTY